MRHLSILFVVLACSSPLLADEARVDIGDPPRTYMHFLNSREAGLCRAAAATGGAEAYFLNPACVSREESVAGQATLRFGTTSREYLPSGEAGLEASESRLLFSQLVAVKRSGSWVFGFGYSSPSYRDLTLTGARESQGVLETYEGTFAGGLRFFEVVLAGRIGRDGRAGAGIAGGLASLSESAREVVGQTLSTAELTGTAGSVAVGLVYDATDRVTLGAGYRWASSIGVSGSWHGQDDLSGTSKTQPTAVAGVSVEAARFLTAHASFVREGWSSTSSTLSAYPEEEGKRGEFDEDIGSVALGVEGRTFEDRLTLRAGGSVEVLSDISEGSVPESAFGLGAAYSFEAYAVDVSLVREQFAVDGVSGDMATWGVYVTAGYRF